MWNYFLHVPSFTKEPASFSQSAFEVILHRLLPSLVYLQDPGPAEAARRFPVSNLFDSEFAKPANGAAKHKAKTSRVIDIPIPPQDELTMSGPAAAYRFVGTCSIPCTTRKNQGAQVATWSVIEHNSCNLRMQCILGTRIHILRMYGLN